MSTVYMYVFDVVLLLNIFYFVIEQALLHLLISAADLNAFLP